MSTTKYIPAGRTSIVKNKNLSLQLQTEYAARPEPRITTTVLDSGRVLHKICRPLPRGIESIEEQNRVEETIQRQHAEVAASIKSGAIESLLNMNSSQPVYIKNKSLEDQIRSKDYVEYVIGLDSCGNLTDKDTAKRIRSDFRALIKSLPEIISIFIKLPGKDSERETGVYEIENNRLYLISTGYEFLLIVVNRTRRDTDPEKELRMIVSSELNPIEEKPN